MEGLFIVCLIIGGIAMLIGGIMMLIEAFKEGIGWGLASLFIPLVLLIFAVTHLDQCKKGLIIWAVGLGIYLIAVAIGASMAGSVMQEEMLMEEGRLIIDLLFC